MIGAADQRNVVQAGLCITTSLAADGGLVDFDRKLTVCSCCGKFTGKESDCLFIEQTYAAPWNCHDACVLFAW